MNDATSHMAPNHPAGGDFSTGNQNKHRPMGVVNPTVGYLDVNELADKFTKKRKGNQDGASKYHSRVPILN